MEINNSTPGWDFIQIVWMFLTRAFENAEPTFGPLGLGVKQVIVLAILEKLDTPMALRKALGAPPSTMTNILNELEKKGLIERQVHPQDRRQMRIVRTELGDAKLAEGVALVEASLQRDATSLTSEEIDILSKSQSILAKLAGLTSA